MHRANQGLPIDLLRETAAGGKPQHLPQLILLDLNMPGTDGREILVDIKRDERLMLIPVVVLSTSRHAKDIAYCYRHGASGHCVKPIDRVSFDETIRAINAF